MLTYKSALEVTGSKRGVGEGVERGSRVSLEVTSTCKDLQRPHLRTDGYLDLRTDEASDNLCMSRCLDMSASSNLVAVVDESSEVHVYELASGALMWSAEGATSAAWNTEFEDMLSYSGNGHLCTKTADLPIQRQKFQVFIYTCIRQFCCVVIL